MDTVSVFLQTSPQYICALLKSFFSPTSLLACAKSYFEKMQQQKKKKEKSVHSSLANLTLIAEKCPATVTQLHSHPTSAASQLRI